MSVRFRTITAGPDQQQYALSLISRQISSVESLQNRLNDYASYGGTKTDAATALATAVSKLEEVQTAIIAAVTAQAAD